MRTGAERGVRHETSFHHRRPAISWTPHPTQNTEPWRRDTACCSAVHDRRGILRFTTAPQRGQYGTGELERRWFMFWQRSASRLGAVMRTSAAE